MIIHHGPAAPPPGPTTPTPGEEQTSIWRLSSLWWVPIVVALIGLAGILLPRILDSNAVPTPASSFDYLVRVQAKDTGQNIIGSQVSIQVAGQAPLNTITDNKGIAIITIGASFINKPGLLIVEATNYKKYTLHINLFKDVLPTVILLEPINNSSPPEEPTSTQEPVPAPTSTPTPTEEPTTEPTVEPTIEPPAPTVEPTITPIPTLELLTFEYQVQVQTKNTEEIVPEAIVKIEISELLSLDGKSDANGFAKIFFDSIQPGQSAVLLIEATGYKSYRQEIESLSLDVLPDIIQLEPESPLEYKIQVKEEAIDIQKNFLELDKPN